MTRMEKTQISDHFFKESFFLVEVLSSNFVSWIIFFLPSAGKAALPPPAQPAPPICSLHFNKDELQGCISGMWDLCLTLTWGGVGSWEQGFLPLEGGGVLVSHVAVMLLHGHILTLLDIQWVVLLQGGLLKPVS